MEIFRSFVSEMTVVVIGWMCLIEIDYNFQIVSFISKRKTLIAFVHLHPSTKTEKKIAVA